MKKRTQSLIVAIILVISIIVSNMNITKADVAADEIVNNWRATSLGTLALLKSSNLPSISDYLKLKEGQQGDLSNMNFIPVYAVGSGSSSISPVIDSDGKHVKVSDIFNTGGLMDWTQRVPLNKDLYVKKDSQGGKELIFTPYILEKSGISSATKLYLGLITYHYLSEKIIDGNYELYVDMYGNILAVKSGSETAWYKNMFNSYTKGGQVPFVVIYPGYLNPLLYKNKKAPGIEPFILSALAKDFDTSLTKSNGKFTKVLDNSLSGVNYGTITNKSEGKIDNIFISKLAAYDKSKSLAYNLDTITSSIDESTEKYFSITANGYPLYDFIFDYFKDKQFKVGEEIYSISSSLTDTKDIPQNILEKFKKDGKLFSVVSYGTNNTNNFTFLPLGIKIEAITGTNAQKKSDIFISKNSFTINKTPEDYKNLLKVVILALGKTLMQDNIEGQGQFSIDMQKISTIQKHINEYNSPEKQTIEGLLVTLEQLDQANTDKSINPNKEFDDFLKTVMTFGLSFVLEKTLTALISSIYYIGFNLLMNSGILFMPDFREFILTKYFFDWALGLTITFIVVYSLFVVILVLQNRTTIRKYFTNVLITCLLLILPFMFVPYISINLANFVSYLLINDNLSTMAMQKTDLKLKNPETQNSTEEILANIVAHYENKNIVRDGKNVIIRDYVGAFSSSNINKENQYKEIDEFIDTALSTSSMTTAAGQVVMEDKAHYVLYQSLYTYLKDKTKSLSSEIKENGDTQTTDLTKTNGILRKYLIKQTTVLSPDPFGLIYTLYNNKDLAEVYLSSKELTTKDTTSKKYINLDSIYKSLNKDKTEYLKSDKYKSLTDRDKDLVKKLLEINEQIYSKALFYVGASAFLTDETLIRYLVLDTVMIMNKEFTSDKAFYPIQYELDKVNTDLVFKMALVSQKDFLTGKIWNTGMFYGDIVAYLLRYNGFITVLAFGLMVVSFFLYMLSKFLLLLLIIIELIIGIQTYVLVINNEDLSKELLIKSFKRLFIWFIIHLAILLSLKLTSWFTNKFDNTFIKILCILCLSFLAGALFKFVQLPMLKELISNIKLMGKTLMSSFGSAVFGTLGTLSGTINLMNSDNLKEAQLKSQKMKEYFNEQNDLYIEELQNRNKKALVEKEDLERDNAIKKKIDEQLKKKLAEDITAIEQQIDTEKKEKATKRTEDILKAINKVSGVTEKVKKTVYGENYIEHKSEELGNTKIVSRVLSGLSTASKILQADKGRFNSTAFVLDAILDKNYYRVAKEQFNTETTQPNETSKEIAIISEELFQTDNTKVAKEEIKIGSSLTGTLVGNEVELEGTKLPFEDLQEISDKIIIEEKTLEDGTTTNILKFKGTKQELNNILDKYKTNMENKIILDKIQQTKDNFRQSEDNTIHLTEDNCEIYTTVLENLPVDAKVEEEFIEMNTEDYTLFKDAVKQEIGVEYISDLNKQDKRQLLTQVLYTKATEQGVADTDIAKYNSLIENTKVYTSNNSMLKLINNVAEKGKEYSSTEQGVILSASDKVTKLLSLSDNIIQKDTEGLTVKTDDIDLIRNAFRYYQQDKDFIIDNKNNTIKIVNKELQDAILSVNQTGTLKQFVEDDSIMLSFSDIAKSRGLEKAFSIFYNAPTVAKQLNSGIIVNKDIVSLLLSEYQQGVDYITDEETGKAIILNTELQERILEINEVKRESQYKKDMELYKLGISEDELAFDIPYTKENGAIYVDRENLGYAIASSGRYLASTKLNNPNLTDIIPNYKEGIDYITHEDKLLILNKQMQQELALNNIELETKLSEPLTISRSTVLKDVKTGKKFIYDYENIDDYLYFLKTNSSIVDLDITSRELSTQNKVHLEELVDFTKKKYKENEDFIIDKANNRIIFNSKINFDEYLSYLEAIKNAFTPLTTQLTRPVLSEFISAGLTEGIDYKKGAKELIIISNRAKDIMKKVYSEEIDREKTNLDRKIKIIKSVLENAKEKKGKITRGINIYIKDTAIANGLKEVLPNYNITNIKSIIQENNMLIIELYDETAYKQTLEELSETLKNIIFEVVVEGLKKEIKYYAKFGLTGNSIELYKSYAKFEEPSDLYTITTKLKYKKDKDKYITKDFIYDEYVYISLDCIDLDKAIYEEDL